MLACASVCVFSTQFKHVGSSFGKRWKCKVDKFVKVFILSMYAKELKVYSLQKVEFLQYHISPSQCHLSTKRRFTVLLIQI